MRPSDPVGRWSASGMLVEIVRRAGDLVVLFADLPEELAPRLRHADADPSAPLTMRGGPYDGLTVTTVDRDGVPHLLIGGTVTMPPWEAPAAGSAVHAIPVWPTGPDPDAEPAYSALLAEARDAGGRTIQPPPDLALGRWVRWLTEQDSVLFHGSADGAIDRLLPRRTSYELDDQAERGNRPAVYATDDGWWAMWFAIIDRGRLRGSMRNAVDDFTDPAGRRVPVYHFSVDYRVLPDRPFRDGWLYLLPRDTFERLPVVPGGPPSHEWCSHAPVTPLARVPVRPSDFPFLDRVGSHDDGDLWRYAELADLVRARVTGGRRSPTGVELRLAWDDALAAVSEEYLSLGRRLMPEMQWEFRRDADGTVWLHVDAPGPLAAMVQNAYAAVLDG